MKKALSIILVIILLPILFVCTVILINSITRPNEVPSFFGWKPFIVLSGSMETEIYSGDIAVVKEIEPSKLKVGDIIAYKNDDIVITHRIVKIVNDDGTTKYITKGDNNNTEDRDYVLPENVEGLYKFKISKLGNFSIFIQTPTGMIACLSIPLILLILVQFSENKKNKKEVAEKEEKQKNLEKEIAELKKQNEKLKTK